MNTNKQYEVNLNEIPKIKNGSNKGKFDWNLSINKYVYFYNESITIKIKIIEYDQKKKKLKIEYENNIHDIYISSLLDCRLGRIVGITPLDFNIEVGTIFKDDKRDLIITDREYRIRYKKNGDKCNDKWYKYTCKVCDWTEGWTTESHLLNESNKRGCSCCHGNTVVKGINDVATTHPHLVKYFANIEDANSYTYSSNKKIWFKCLECGLKKEMKINTLYHRGFSCNKCGDGISLPNKTMYNILKQLQMNFILEYSPDWIGQKRYDFYIPSINLIIEMDGGWHTQDNNMSGQTSEESKAIDDYKDEQAKLHGMTVVRIDCDYGNDYARLNYVKQNLLNNNKLNKLINLSYINWDNIEELVMTNIMKIACEYKRENNNLTTTQIGKIMGFSGNAISRWLKQGNELRWCHYDTKEENLKKGKKRIKIFKNEICLGLFSSIKELSLKSKEMFNIELNKDSISRAVSKNKLYKGFGFEFA